MAHMTITDADRDATGRIIVQAQAPAAAERSLADLLPAREAETPAAAAPVAWRPGRYELAGIVGGLLLAVVLIAAINTFVPQARPVVPRSTEAPTARPTNQPTARPTVVTTEAHAAPDGAYLGTVPLSATVAYRHSAYPGWGGVAWKGAIVWIRSADDLSALPDLAPPTPLPLPTPRPLPAPAPAADAPCDPETNPRYTAPLLVVPFGSVVGASCVSQAEADANAVQLAEEMRRKAEE